MSDYVEIEGVKYQGASPTGKAIFVTVDGHNRTVPVSVIAADSEVGGAGPGVTEGVLRVARWFAEKEELLDAVEGSGLVLRKLPRARLTPPEYRLSEGQLKKMLARARALPPRNFNTDTGEVWVDGEVVGLLDEQPELGLFIVYGAADVAALVAEVRALRAWANKVTGGSK